MNDWFADRGPIEKLIAGALKSAILAHGPITIDNRCSAAKRIYTALREFRRQGNRSRDQGIITYACGYREEKGAYGMFHGPNPSLEKMLDVVPDQDLEAFIFRFNADGTDDLIYKWTGETWIEMTEEEANEN